MLNNVPRTWLVAVWLTTVAVIIGASIAMDAKLSTTALLLVVGIAPAVVVMFLRAGTPEPTVSEILYAVDERRGR